MAKKKVDGRSKNGGVRTNAGRKTKAQELKLIERLAPYDDMVQRKLLELCEEGEFKAISLFYAYRYGKPRETKDITVSTEQPLFNIDYEDISTDIEPEED